MEVNKMKTSAIYNLYERKNSLQSTIEQMEAEIKRNEGIIDVLNRASDKEKKDLEIDEFVKKIQEQVDNFRTQKDKLQKMLNLNDAVIKMYEDNKEQYELILNSVLTSFGFEEAEN